jgi:hypothetical protein
MDCEQMRTEKKKQPNMPCNMALKLTPKVASESVLSLGDSIGLGYPARQLSSTLYH